MQSQPRLQHSALITARKSTAEELQQTLGIENQSQLIRNLIEEKVQELDVV